MVEFRSDIIHAIISVDLKLFAILKSFILTGSKTKYNKDVNRKDPKCFFSLIATDVE